MLGLLTGYFGESELFRGFVLPVLKYSHW